MELTYDSIVGKLIHRIKSEYEIEDDLNDNTDVMATDMDSLDRMNYMLFIEETFGVTIDEGQIELDGIFVIGKTARFILETAK